MKDLNEKAAQNLSAIREQKPLIHNITNYVVMNYTANALLAMGVSPVMAHAQNEVEDMVSFAGALVLNIGRLGCHTAAHRGCQKNYRPNPRKRHPWQCLRNTFPAAC